MMNDSKVLLSLIALSAVLLVAMVVQLTADNSRAEFEGVWRTAEVVVPGPHQQSFKPGATLAIFHGKHYSRVEVHAEDPRPALKDVAAASADDLRAAWGPFFGEAGTFELSGGVVTMQALVAKNPAAMIHGATSAFTYQRNGDTLTLTQVRTALGPAPAPITVKMMRVE
jgi:hypothetical protein